MIRTPTPWPAGFNVRSKWLIVGYWKLRRVTAADAS